MTRRKLLSTKSRFQGNSNRAVQRGGVTKRITQGSLLKVDARLALIAKSNANITDARQRLVRMPSFDARQRIEQKSQSGQSRRPNTGIKKPRGASRPAAAAAPKNLFREAVNNATQEQGLKKKKKNLQFSNTQFNRSPGNQQVGAGLSSSLRGRLGGVGGVRGGRRGGGGRGGGVRVFGDMRQRLEQQRGGAVKLSNDNNNISQTLRSDLMSRNTQHSNNGSNNNSNRNNNNNSSSNSNSNIINNNRDNGGSVFMSRRAGGDLRSDIERLSSPSNSSITLHGGSIQKCIQVKQEPGRSDSSSYESKQSLMRSADQSRALTTNQMRDIKHSATNHISANNTRHDEPMDVMPANINDMKEHVSPLQGVRVIVSNLMSSVTQEDIVELFGAVGAMKRVRLLKGGRAEVVFVEEETARAAVNKYHHRELDGKPMLVTVEMSSDESRIVKRPETFATTDKSNSKPPVSTVDLDLDVLHRALFKVSSNTKSSAILNRPVNFTVHM